jgi:hypothetical protein
MENQCDGQGEKTTRAESKNEPGLGHGQDLPGYSIVSIEDSSQEKFKEKRNLKIAVALVWACVFRV